MVSEGYTTQYYCQHFFVSRSVPVAFNPHGCTSTVREYRTEFVCMYCGLIKPKGGVNESLELLQSKGGVMTQIKISIDCDGEYCGDCHQRNWNLLTDEFCFLFRDEHGAPTFLEQDGLEFKRCDECLKSDWEYSPIRQALKKAESITEVRYKINYKKD